MKFNVIKADLFTMPTDNILAHCISADFALGAGIAKIFRDKLGIKEELERRYTGEWDDRGYCAFTNEAEWLVANLVTKERSFHKPTYASLRQALEDFRRLLTGITPKEPTDKLKIAMPLIGCGLDGLDWNKVSEIIKDVFRETEVVITVCVLE